MSRRRGSVQRERGFSLVELLIVVIISFIIAAMAVPQFIAIRRNARTIGDARNINSQILLAKMRAAATFSRARAYFDLTPNAGNFRLEVWDRTNNCWRTEGEPTCATQPSQPLSQGVNFGFGALGIAPGCPAACTQPAIGQALACRPGSAGNPGGGGDLANTACIVFNSRGIPVDNGGNPFGDGAIYITDTVSVYASTVSITGVIQAWRTDQAAANWFRR